MYSPDFETFWQAYPKKVAKRMAWKVWEKQQPPLQDVLIALSWQREQDQWAKDGGQFVPHPTTYLNQGRWEDEKPEQKKAAYPSWY